MSTHECTLAIIFDAALDETLWPASLKKLSDLTGSQGREFLGAGRFGKAAAFHVHLHQFRAEIH